MGTWPAVSLLLLMVVLAAWALWATIRLRGCGRELGQWRHRLSEAEQGQRQAEQKLAALAQAAPAAQILLDEKGQVAWANIGAQSLLTSPVGEPPRFQHAALSEVIALTQRDGREHTRQFNLDGNVYLARSIPLPGPPSLIALTVEDVTELQRLGRARRDFVANISHDLRTPIATIQLLVETLQAGAMEKPKKRTKLLDGIASQTLTLQQLAQELMDLSMIESGRMPLRLVETPLSHIIDPAIARLMSQIERQHLQLVRQYDPHLQVLADAESLQRVLQNLLHNAIKFTPEGGVVAIGARATPDEVQVFVRDTGPGIPPEHLDRIFERFYKTDSSRTSGGSGLGLAIARHIVEGHGGRIWAESAPGEGATFYFTLLRG